MPSMIFKIKRRSSGGTGAPSSLAQGELAYNELDDTLWYGKGTTPTPYLIAGLGGFVGVNGNQTIATGIKTFSSGSFIDAQSAGYVKVPTAANATNDVTAASTAFVKNVAQPLSTFLSSVAAVGLGILVQSSSGVATARTLQGATQRIVITNPAGAAGDPTIDLGQPTISGTVGTAYPKITFDLYGRVTAGAALALGDLPSGTALTGSATTFTAGLNASQAIAQNSNNTTVATTAWVHAAGLGATPTITTYSTTPQTLTGALAGGLIIYNGGSSGAFTLPAANNGQVAGSMLVISNNSANTLTLSPGGAGPDNLDEGTTIVMAAKERIGLICDGVNTWRTAWRSNYANPIFGGNVTVSGTLSAGAAGFSVDATGNTTLKSLTISTAQAANTFFAGPNGSSGSAVFRRIAAADLPLAVSNTTAGAVIINTNATTGGLTNTGGTISANVTRVATLTGDITAANLAAQLTTLATLASPTFTGAPLAPTAAYATNNTQIATTAFVRAVSHDQLAVPQADVDWGGKKLINLAEPTLATHAATKNYVDTSVQGLAIKPTAAAATTAALPSNTYNNGTAGVGATLTATANGVLTVDGVAIALNAYVLVKNEVSSANNGLYKCTQAGSAGAPYILTRDIDMDLSAEFSGAFIPVGAGGTVNTNTLWLCNPSGAVTVGTTSIPFTQLNGATSLTSGNGILISGNTISAVGTANRIFVSGSGIDIAATYVGQTSLTTLGTIATGTWNGTAIGSAYGGLGASFAGSTGLLVFTSGVAATVATIAYTNLPLQSGVQTALTSATGFGTMSAQNANNVAITGGAIDGITLDAGTF